MTNSLINWVLTYPKRFIFFILLITLAAGCFVYKNISVNTANTDLLSKELTFRKNDIAFKKEFPQFSNNIIVVIDGYSKQTTKHLASNVYKNIKLKEKSFNDIFYPEELDFFKTNGFLYLSIEELENKLDEISKYQPFISRLSDNQTLYELLNTLNLFLIADLDKKYLISINKLLDDIEGLSRITGGVRKKIIWENVFSNEKENINFFREIIYLQPKNDERYFFPAARSIYEIEEIIEYQESKYSKVLNYLTPSISVTGTALMELTELNELQRDSKDGILISLGLVILILLYAFKYKRNLFIANILTLIIGLIWTTAFALLCFNQLNLISIAFAILFIGLGIDFSIHYTLRSREFITDIKDKKPGMYLINTYKSIATTLVLTAVAISIGFYSFTLTSFSGLAELGVIAGTGMFISLFLTLFFLPAILILKPIDHGPEYTHDTNSRMFNFGYNKHFLHFTYFNIHAKRNFLFAFSFLLFSLYNLSNVKFETDPLKLRNNNWDSVKTMNSLIRTKDIDHNSVNILADDLSQASELKNKISDLKEVKEVSFFKDLIPENQEQKLEILDQFNIFFPNIRLKEKKNYEQNSFENEKKKINNLLSSIEEKVLLNYEGKIEIENVKKLKNNISSYQNIVDLIKLEKNIFYYFNINVKELESSLKAKKITEKDIPEELKKRYIGKNGKIRLEVVPSQDLNNKKNKEAFVQAVYNISPTISGGAFTTYEAGDAIVQSFKEAMIISLSLITLFLFFTLRNFKKVFIVFFNLVAALLFSLSLLTLLGYKLNFANIIALPLLFGLGAATSIQTVLRTEKYKKLENYFEESSTPRAIIFSLLTTLGAFFVLSFSSHLGTSSMGVLLIISIFSIYLANLTILLPLEKYFFKK